MAANESWALIKAAPAVVVVGTAALVVVGTGGRAEGVPVAVVRRRLLVNDELPEGTGSPDGLVTIG